MTHWNDPGADPLADIRKIGKWILEQKGFQSFWFLAYLELSEFDYGYVVSINLEQIPTQVDQPIRAIFRSKEPIPVWSTELHMGVIEAKLKLQGYSFDCEVRLLTLINQTEYEVLLLVKSYEKIDYLKEWHKND